jgi:uncharacterized membrane protein YbhN (UPF0104 family)
MNASRLFRRVIVAVLMAGAVAFAITNGPALAAAVGGLRHAALGPMLAGLALSAIAIVNRAATNRAAHLAVGLDVPRWSMLRPTTAGFAADKIVRSGGVSGATVLVRHGTRHSYPHGSVLAATLLARVASFAALGILMTGAVIALLLSGHLTTLWLAAAIGFVVYALVAAVIAIVLIRRRDLAERLWAGLARRAPRIAASVGPDPVGEVATALTAARCNGPLVRRVMAHAIGGKALGVAMLLAAGLAVGLPISATGALVAYATALLASLASMTPGGLGAVEGSTTALLVAAGAGIAPAAVAVALFRIFDLWIPVAAGAAVMRDPRQRPAAEPDSAHIVVWPATSVTLMAGQLEMVTP